MNKANPEGLSSGYYNNLSTMGGLGSLLGSLGGTGFHYYYNNFPSSYEPPGSYGWYLGGIGSSPGGGGFSGGGGGGGSKVPTPTPSSTTVPSASDWAKWAGAPGGSNWLSALTPTQWAKLGLGAYGFLQGNSSGQGFGAGHGGTVNIPGYLTGPGARVAGAAGYGNLLNILLSQGRTDPQAMNRLIASTQRGTQNQMGQFQGEMARRGLQNSGVGMAMEQAIGAAGQDRVAGIRAEEARLAEERKRQDLDLLLRLIVQPQQDWTALQTGQYNANRASSNQEKAADNAMWGELLGALVGFFI